MCVLAGEIQKTAFVAPFGRHGEVKVQVFDQALEKLPCFFTSLVHSPFRAQANLGFTFLAPAGTESTISVPGGRFFLFMRLMTICWPKLTILPKNQYSKSPDGADHITHSIMSGIKYVII